MNTSHVTTEKMEGKWGWEPPRGERNTTLWFISTISNYLILLKYTNVQLLIAVDPSQRRTITSEVVDPINCWHSPLFKEKVQFNSILPTDRWAKRTSYIPYDDRKCGTPLRVFFQTPAHVNNKNEISHRNRGRRWEEKNEYERNTASMKKGIPTGYLQLGPTVPPPPRSLLPKAVNELPNEPNIHL